MFWITVIFIMATSSLDEASCCFLVSEHKMRSLFFILIKNKNIDLNYFILLHKYTAFALITAFLFYAM